VIVAKYFWGDAAVVSANARMVANLLAGMLTLIDRLVVNMLARMLTLIDIDW
jgi:hypothetical protein